MNYLNRYLNDESYMADKHKLGDLWIVYTKSEDRVYYSSEIDNSLCFTAIEDNASVQMRLKDSGNTPAGWQDKSFYYKKNDDVEWTELVFENNTTSLITLYEGEKLYVMSDSYNSCAVHGDGTIDECKYYYFNISGGKISASGNIMSLLNFTPVLPNYAFYQLFQDCTSLVSAPDLPVTTLTEGCYKSMFSGCRSLTQVPELPATTLAASCYSGMFTNCSSLVSVPALPATTLVDSCYYQMFLGCSSLTHAPELPATTLASNCYLGMFSNCSSLTQAPALPATTLAEGCYQSMFGRCSSLTKAPELPATTLVKSCYNQMFRGCSKLNYIKALFTTKPSGTYTKRWVSGVPLRGTFVKSSATTWNVTGVRGISGIPILWKVTTV